MSEMVDHERLLAEIDAEVERRRASGELPAELERELDLVFARYAPVHAIEGDFDQVLERAQQATFIDVLAPVDSARPGVPFVKRLVRKLVLWVVRHVAQQVSAFAEAITKAVRLLGERVDALEQALPSTVHDLPAGAGAVPDAEHWARALPAVLPRVGGRVLVAECGDGVLVDALVAAGFDAYGVEPDARTSSAATRRGTEVRCDAVAEHVALVPEGTLGGAVLAGWTDRLALPARQALLDAVLARLRPGAPVVVLATDPRVWEAERPAVEVDLAPGRPLRPATWQHLLAERGAGVTGVHAGPRDERLEPVADAGPALAANLERIAEVLFPPRSHAVVATAGGAR